VKRAFCPNCGSQRDLSLIIDLRTLDEGDGVLRTRRIETSRCRSCGRFVSAEERDLTPEDSASSP